MTPAQANRIVELILEDLCDRSGLGDEWSNIDDSVQAEIRTEWASIIIAEIEDKI